MSTSTHLTLSKSSLHSTANICSRFLSNWIYWFLSSLLESTKKVIGWVLLICQLIDIIQNIHWMILNWHAFVTKTFNYPNQPTLETSVLQTLIVLFMINLHASKCEFWVSPAFFCVFKRGQPLTCLYCLQTPRWWKHIRIFRGSSSGSRVGPRSSIADSCEAAKSASAQRGRPTSTCPCYFKAPSKVQVECTYCSFFWNLQPLFGFSTKISVMYSVQIS